MGDVGGAVGEQGGKGNRWQGKGERGEQPVRAYRLARDAYVHGRGSVSARTYVAALHIELARRIEY